MKGRLVVRIAALLMLTIAPPFLVFGPVEIGRTRILATIILLTAIVAWKARRRISLALELAIDGAMATTLMLVGYFQIFPAGWHVQEIFVYGATGWLILAGWIVSLLPRRERAVA